MKCAATLAVAAAAVCLASVQAQCPGNFVNFGETSMPICLYFLQSKNTFFGTRQVCQALSADLAKLTGDLHEDVAQYINMHSELKDNSFWIGGTDQAVEGSWKWIVDNTDIPLGTPHWYPCNNQPNGGTEQNYLSLYTPDFYFHSLEGSREIYGICQI